MAQLSCIVVTPENVALETEADFVALPLFDGEIGIAPDHSPMIGRLGYGEMRIRNAGNESRFYVDGGFVQVANNVVSVLTGRALASKSVDPTAAQKSLDSALKKPIHTAELLAIRDREIQQARAQMRVASRSR
ncbi:MAG: ATP synthase F1 subunit epsilon [Planctomycetes bacterium]|nr:ATP synthase F1 subunit epsilon [Planctomycetota bacterium]